MKTIKHDLPEELTSIEVHTFADTHIGEPECDLKLVQSRIDYVAKKDNAFIIVNGDLINNATKTSVSDIYAEKLKPMQQLELVESLFLPVKDKILYIGPGNHEARTYKMDGIDITALIAQQLGVAHLYSPTTGLLFIRFGYNVKQRKQVYTIFVNHGTGGGRKAGGKVNRLSDMAGIVDADVYIHSHTHLPVVMREAFYRVSMGNSSVALADKLFINTGATLDYGGYGETYEFRPASKETPVLYLSGTEKKMKARL